MESKISQTEQKQTGVELIAQERKAQIEKHGFTPQKDKALKDGELAMMAACYAAPAIIYIQKQIDNGFAFVDPFPLKKILDERYAENGMTKRATNPFYYGKSDAIKMLARAGALIAAEIDRIQAIEDAAEYHKL